MKWILAAVGYLLVVDSVAFAIAKQESILDRLERRLLEQERNALNFDSGVSELKQPAKTSFKFKSKYIDELSPSNADVKKLGDAISELEAQTEYLASQVHRIKQKILHEAAINNMINFSTRLDDSDKLAFRSLTVTIDGHEIYKQNAALGLWLPHNEIPVFQGPMQPGNHRIDFEARVVQKATDNLPIQNDTYHIIQETFNFVVPDGKVMKKWEVYLTGENGNSSIAKAQLKALQ